MRYEVHRSGIQVGTPAPNGQMSDANGQEAASLEERWAFQNQVLPPLRDLVGKIATAQKLRGNSKWAARLTEMAEDLLCQPILLYARPAEAKLPSAPASRTPVEDMKQAAELASVVAPPPQEFATPTLDASPMYVERRDAIKAEFKKILGHQSEKHAKEMEVDKKRIAELEASIDR